MRRSVDLEMSVSFCVVGVATFIFLFLGSGGAIPVFPCGVNGLLGSAGSGPAASLTSAAFLGGPPAGWIEEVFGGIFGFGLVGTLDTRLLVRPLVATLACQGSKVVGSVLFLLILHSILKKSFSISKIVENQH